MYAKFCILCTTPLHTITQALNSTKMTRSGTRPAHGRSPYNWIDLNELHSIPPAESEGPARQIPTPCNPFNVQAPPIVGCGQQRDLRSGRDRDVADSPGEHRAHTYSGNLLTASIWLSWRSKPVAKTPAPVRPMQLNRPARLKNVSQHTGHPMPRHELNHGQSARVAYVMLS